MYVAESARSANIFGFGTYLFVFPFKFKSFQSPTTSAQPENDVPDLTKFCTQESPPGTFCTQALVGRSIWVQICTHLGTKNNTGSFSAHHRRGGGHQSGRDPNGGSHRGDTTADDGADGALYGGDADRVRQIWRRQHSRDQVQWHLREAGHNYQRTGLVEATLQHQLTSHHRQSANTRLQTVIRFVMLLDNWIIVIVDYSH